DRAGARRLAESAARVGATSDQIDALCRARTLLIAPPPPGREPAGVKPLADFRYTLHDPWREWVRAVAHVRLGQGDTALARLAGAVAARPGDPEVWQARARLFVKIGRKDRAAADLVRAQAIEADDPRAWVETGRVLAELGDAGRADAAFAKASALGRGEPNRF